MKQSCIKEKPILFSGATIRAILDGSKTQTRRIIKHPIDSDIAGLKTTGNGLWQFHHDANDTGTGLLEIVNIKCPYGAVGSKLWVRETWAEHPFDYGFIYRATDPGWDSEFAGILWKPSIHMPKQASRITLKITDIRVERLNVLSEKDSIAEGFDSIASFKLTWNQLNQKRGWEWQTNPWVWILEFRKASS